MVSKPHTERWAYQKLYRDNVFAFATRLYPWTGRAGARFLCRSVAWTYARTQPAIREIVRQNLSLLKNEPATDREATRVFLNYAENLADYVGIGTLRTEETKKLFGSHHGGEHLLDCTAGGKGAILATGHYGFFEFGCLILAEMGCPMAVATLPEPSSELTAWRADWRARWGAKTIPVGADPFSSIEVARAIEDGHCLALLADRPIGERGLAVDLPGGKIPFSISPALLGWMTGRPILPATIFRQADGRYSINTLPPITVRRVPHGERNAEIARCTRELAAALIPEFRRDPSQWYQFVPLAKPEG